MIDIITQVFASRADYFYAWMAYLAAFLLMTIGFWQLTKIIKWRFPRDLVRGVYALIFLLPIKIVAPATWYSPAFIAALMAYLNRDSDLFEKVLLGFQWSLLAVLLLVCVSNLMVYILSKKTAEVPEN